MVKKSKAGANQPSRTSVPVERVAKAPIVTADPKVVSIQVTPFTIDNDDEVHVQPEGPNEHTEGWAVYQRFSNGPAMWLADTANKEDAEFIGRAYAKHQRVAIEPYPWLTVGA